MNTLRRLLTLTSMTLAIVPLVLLGGLLGWFGYHTHLESSYRLQQIQAREAGLNVLEFFKDIEDEMHDLALYNDLLKLPDYQMRTVFLMLLSEKSMLRDVTVLDNKGGKRLFVSSRSAVSDDSTTVWSRNYLFQEAIASRKSVYGRVFTDPTSSEPIMRTAIPFQNLQTGTVELVVIASLRLKEVWDYLARLNTNPDERIYMLDEEGFVVAHPNPSKVLSRTRFKHSPGPRLVSVDGESVLYAEKAIALGNRLFFIVAEIGAYSALSSSLHSAKVFLGVMCFALVMAFSLLAITARRFITPIEDLAQTAKAIRDGDLERRARGSVFLEIDELAKSFNTMTAKLQNSLVSLRSEMDSRLEMEEALKLSEERVSLALDATSDGLWDWDVGTGEVYYSPGYVAMLGYDSVDLPTHLSSWLDLIHPEDADRAFGVNRKCLNNEVRDFSVEFRMQHKNGSWVWILGRGKAVERDENGIATRMVGTHTNITDRKNAEVELQQSEQRFRLLVEAMPVLIHAHDEHGKYIYWNRTCEEVLGWTKEDILNNENAPQVLYPDPEKRAYVDSIHSDLPNYYELEVAVTTKSGGERLIHWKESSKSIRVPGWSTWEIGLDVTEQRKVERELIDAKEQAEAANRSKSEFLANMSHEIRTPINGLIGMLQLLETTELEEEQLGFVTNAVQSSKRLTRLLSDILDLSRVEAGKMVIQPETFNISDVVRQVTDLFSPVAGQERLALISEIDPDLPQWVEGDPARIQQVLNNLVGNSLKFTEQGTVTVRAIHLSPIRQGQSRVLFCVEDTGIGIEDENIAALFNPFTQASEGYSRQYQGAGLGLAICRKLIELMGGNIAVCSEHGQGTAIYFALSFAAPQAIPVRAQLHKKPSSATTPKGCRVLLAEDDRMSRLVAVRFLERAGCSVTAVSDGEQAVQALSEEEHDIVFMDVQMPVLSGIEATRAIRDGKAGTGKAEIPIIAMTAYAMSGDKDKMLSAGMNDYLSKPVDKDELYALLSRYFGVVEHPDGAD